MDQNASWVMCDFYLGEFYFSYDSKFFYAKSKYKSTFTVFNPSKYSSESNKIVACQNNLLPYLKEGYKVQQPTK